MRLTHLEADGFCCFRDLQLDFDPLTVLIGENDAGKSTVLDILNLFLNDQVPEDKCFRKTEFGDVTDKIEAILIFSLTGNEDPEALEFTYDNQIKVKKIFYKSGGFDFYYCGEKPADDNVVTDISHLSAEQQKQIIIDIDNSIKPSEISNNEKRTAWYNDYLKTIKKKYDWMTAPARLSKLLPRFDRYRAIDYSQPENIVAKVLRQVFEYTIQEEVQDEEAGVIRKFIEPLLLVDRMARKNIQEKVKELEAYLQKYDDRIKRVGYEPTFDFKSSMRTGEFMLDRGYGLHALSRIGDGSKRRMLMAVTDWDRDLSIQQAKSGLKLQSVIRGYDEPDSNLHYNAQRLLYYSILDIVNSENSCTQAILCTHSLTMIDRAPAQSIRLLTLDESGCTKVSQLDTDEDPNVEYFLKHLALEIGITNSLMFYDRCFVLIEGETELAALPILYRRVCNRSIFEDSIRIINVQTNSAVAEFLKIFGYNYQEMIIVFVDSDTKDNKSANLTAKYLKSLGYSDDFIENRFIYIGKKEFEDAFCNEAIVRALQSKWHKKNGKDWQPQEIEAIRQKGGKFSDKLQKLVWYETSQNGERWTKPVFGRALAETCHLEEIPLEINKLFGLAQKITRKN